MINVKYKNQARYTNRSKEKGLVRCTVWIPQQDISKVKTLAKSCRDEHYEQQGFNK